MKSTEKMKSKGGGKKYFLNKGIHFMDIPFQCVLKVEEPFSYLSLSIHLSSSFIYLFIFSPISQYLL